MRLISPFRASMHACSVSCGTLLTTPQNGQFMVDLQLAGLSARICKKGSGSSSAKSRQRSVKPHIQIGHRQAQIGDRVVAIQMPIVAKNLDDSPRKLRWAVK